MKYTIVNRELRRSINKDNMIVITKACELAPDIPVDALILLLSNMSSDHERNEYINKLRDVINNHDRN